MEWLIPLQSWTNSSQRFTFPSVFILLHPVATVTHLQRHPQACPAPYMWNCVVVTVAFDCVGLRFVWSVSCLLTFYSTVYVISCDISVVNLMLLWYSIMQSHCKDRNWQFECKLSIVLRKKLQCWKNIFNCINKKTQQNRGLFSLLYMTVNFILKSPYCFRSVKLRHFGNTRSARCSSIKNWSKLTMWRGS